jgi:hypothetical protein
MNILGNLKYAPGSVKKVKRIGRGVGSAMARLQRKDTRDKNRDLEMFTGHGLKAGRCR